MRSVSPATSIYRIEVRMTALWSLEKHFGAITYTVQRVPHFEIAETERLSFKTTVVLTFRVADKGTSFAER
jgi:hypothetical protein